MVHLGILPTTPLLRGKIWQLSLRGSHVSIHPPTKLILFQFRFILVNDHCHTYPKLKYVYSFVIKSGPNIVRIIGFKSLQPKK